MMDQLLNDVVPHMMEDCQAHHVSLFPFDVYENVGFP